MSQFPTRVDNIGKSTSLQATFGQDLIRLERQPPTFNFNFNFNGLPKELRLMIYEHLPHLGYRHHPGPDHPILWKDWAYDSAILRTGREVHDEAAVCIRRIVSKPIRTEFFLPSVRSLSFITSLLLDSKVKDLPPKTALPPLAYAEKGYQSPAQSRLRHLHDRVKNAKLIEVRALFGPISRIVDPERFISNVESAISRLDEVLVMAGRGRDWEVELTFLVLEGEGWEDREGAEQARAQIESTEVRLKWKVVTREEMGRV